MAQDQLVFSFNDYWDRRTLPLATCVQRRRQHREGFADHRHSEMESHLRSGWEMPADSAGKRGRGQDQARMSAGTGACSEFNRGSVPSTYIRSGSFQQEPAADVRLRSFPSWRKGDRHRPWHRAGPWRLEMAAEHAWCPRPRPGGEVEVGGRALFLPDLRLSPRQGREVGMNDQCAKGGTTIRSNTVGGDGGDRHARCAEGRAGEAVRLPPPMKAMKVPTSTHGRDAGRSHRPHQSATDPSSGPTST